MFVDRRYATNFTLIISATTCLALLPMLISQTRSSSLIASDFIQSPPISYTLTSTCIWCIKIVPCWYIIIMCTCFLAHQVHACGWIQPEHVYTSCLQLSECLRSLVTRIFITTRHRMCIHIYTWASCYR